MYQRLGMGGGNSLLAGSMVTLSLFRLTHRSIDYHSWNPVPNMDLLLRRVYEKAKQSQSMKYMLYVGISRTLSTRSSILQLTLLCLDGG